MLSKETSLAFQIYVYATSYNNLNMEGNWYKYFWNVHSFDERNLKSGILSSEVMCLVRAHLKILLKGFSRLKLVFYIFSTKALRRIRLHVWCKAREEEQSSQENLQQNLRMQMNMHSVKAIHITSTETL